MQRMTADFQQRLAREMEAQEPEETSDCQYAKATAQEEGLCGYVIN